MAAFASVLLVSPPSQANTVPVGMVTHAERAHVGEAAASEGSTIYEGDRLSTESDGAIRIASPALTLQLEPQTALVLSRPVSPKGATMAELSCGTLIFSVARDENLLVAAGDAMIRTMPNSAVVAHIRVVNRRELRINAKRGALEFSYHGESATIPGGTAYRVLLDPSEAEARTLTDPDLGKKSLARPHLGKFIFVAVGVALGTGIPLSIHHMESPHKPGPPHQKP